MKRHLVTGLSLFFLLAGSQAQDMVFSQFYSSPLYLNPGFAGTSEFARVSLGYRNQNPALGSVYVSNFASYDQYVELLQGGIGVNLMHDVQADGTLRMVSFDGIYAYQLVVNPGLTISAGLQGSYGYRFIRTGHLQFPDGINAADGSYTQVPDNNLSENRGFIDFSVGFLGITRSSYIGFAAHHLNKPNMSLSSSKRVPLPWKLTLHGGTVFSLYERRFGREAVKLNPNLHATYQGAHIFMNYGLDVWAGPVLGGLWIRQNIPFSVSSVVMVVGYSTDFFRLAYSHDFSVSSASRNLRNSGAHEVTFSLKIQYNGGQRSRSRAIKFPIF